MLKKLLLSILPEKMQASMFKKKGYKKNLKTEQILDTHPFIQVRFNKNKRGALIIDIDDRKKFKTMQDIIEYCKVVDFPIPTIVLETTKGFHAWWVLDNILEGNKTEKVVAKWKYITSKLFLADSSFSMFIARNPLLHKHIITGVTLSDEELYGIVGDISLSKVKKESKKESKLLSRRFNVNLREVDVGQRNFTLYNVLRDWCFINYPTLNEDKVIEKARWINSQFKTPQNDDEIVPVARSVYTFVKTHYNPAYHSDLREYNRKLADIREAKYLVKLRDGLVQAIMDNVLRVDNIIDGTYSLRHLERMLPVSRKTITRHIDLIRDWLKVLKYNLDNKDTLKNKYKAHLVDIIFDVPVNFIEFVCEVDFGENGYDIRDDVELLVNISEQVIYNFYCELSKIILSKRRSIDG